MVLLLIDNMVINLGGQEIDDQVNQSKYAAADGNTGEKQPGVGHFQCAEAALDHGECEHRMNDCGKQRQEKYGEHLRVDAGAYLLFRQSHLTHDGIPPGVLKSFGYLLVVDNQNGGHKERQPQKDPQKE